jgi:hypothetical protein
LEHRFVTTRRYYEASIIAKPRKNLKFMALDHVKLGPRPAASALRAKCAELFRLAIPVRDESCRPIPRSGC